MDRIEFDSDELTAAEQWHGGQSSMLYAIASTGALSRGTIRPTDEDDKPMSDAAWLAYLADKLETEASKCARFADGDDVWALESIAEKCRDAIAQLTPNT